MADNVTEATVVGGVDTHKDLHVAAVVDQNNKVLGTQYFSATRQGYRQMLVADFSSASASCCEFNWSMTRWLAELP